MEKVLHYLREFKPVSKAFFEEQRQATVAADYEFFREFSKPENLNRADWPDFQKIGDHLNCFRRMGIARGNALGRPNHPIERYKASFIYLVHGPGTLVDRIRKFRYDDQYRLEYFGDSAVSELVGYLFPNEFVFYNARDEFAADFLEIQPNLIAGDDFVDRLTKFAEATRPVAKLYEEIVQKQTSLPLNLELDQFFSWIYEEHAGEAAPTASSYWVIGASEGATRWDEFYKQGIVSIGWDELGDLRQYRSQADVLRALKEKYEDEGNPTNNAKSCFDFAHTLKIGDGVFVKQGRTKLLGFGVVESGYTFEPNRSSHFHIRKVQWLKKGDFPLPKDINLSIKTVTAVTDDELLTKLKTAVGLDSSPPGEIPGPGTAISYWWLNANPKIWDFSDLAVGEKQTYTTHDEKGNKRQKYKYFFEAKPGDLVVGYVTSPDREVVAICKVSKGIHQTLEGESIEFEKVEQLTTPIPLEELQRLPTLKQAEPLINNQGSLFRLTPEEYEAIRELVDDSTPPPQLKLPAFTLKDALKSVFLTEGQFELLLNSLNEKKNIILQGPPGVGKTFIARRLAFALMGEQDFSRFEWIQFHQSYSYEDFIQGFRPTDNGHFALKNGIFYQFCRKAQRDLNGRPWVFVIDEINRGNMSKSFGELMMLLEPDKRGKSFAIPLTYSKEPDETFFVSENVHLIGLMNTADRSLAMVDYALRRRFRFLTLLPAFGSAAFRQYLLERGAEQQLIEKIVQRFSELNLQIAGDEKNLGPGYQIGHSYFCASSDVVLNEKWYRRIVELEIRPLLEEYWLDDQSKVSAIVERLVE
ncbi:MAG TPA: AAA family ATPase [Candidatus Acidoferrum sp.]|nr:AAA family ATPase [Candidatus Acidoferrum sp.]